MWRRLGKSDVLVVLRSKGKSGKARCMTLSQFPQLSNGVTASSFHTAMETIKGENLSVDDAWACNNGTITMMFLIPFKHCSGKKTKISEQKDLRIEMVQSNQR